MVTLSSFTWGWEGTRCPFLGPAFSTKCVQSPVSRLPLRMSLPAGTGHGQEVARHPRSPAHGRGGSSPPSLGQGVLGSLVQSCGFIPHLGSLLQPAPAAAARFCHARGPHAPTAGRAVGCGRHETAELGLGVQGSGGSAREELSPCCFAGGLAEGGGAGFSGRPAALCLPGAPGRGVLASRAGCWVGARPEESCPAGGSGVHPAAVGWQPSAPERGRRPAGLQPPLSAERPPPAQGACGWGGARGQRLGSAADLSPLVLGSSAQTANSTCPLWKTPAPG